MGELDKLEAFARGRASLTLDDVTEVLGRGLGRPVYRLGDAVMGRELGLALELIQEMLEQGGEGPYLVGVLFRVVNQLLATRALRASRTPAGEIAQRIGFPPFKLNEMLEAAGAWSGDELRAALRALAGADRALKRGADARVTLTAAVVRICSPVAPTGSSARDRNSGGLAAAGVVRPARGGGPTRSRAGR
jgi:DNA polymerase-3 subunit delta